MLHWELSHDQLLVHLKQYLWVSLIVSILARLIWTHAHETCTKFKGTKMAEKNVLVVKTTPLSTMHYFNICKHLCNVFLSLVPVLLTLNYYALQEEEKPPWVQNITRGIASFPSLPMLFTLYERKSGRSCKFCDVMMMQFGMWFKISIYSSTLNMPALHWDIRTQHKVQRLSNNTCT